MIEKILENENCGLIVTIAAMFGVFVFNEIGKSSRVAMENGYDVSAKFADRGEVNVKPSGKKKKKKNGEQEDDEDKEDELKEEESDVTG